MAILGPNGAGKTTLLRCIMGLIRWNSGSSLLDGRDIRTMSYRQLWQTLAYVPQAKHTSAAYTTEEMILLGRSSLINMLSRPKAEDIDKVDEIMDRLRIKKLANKKCSEISGGELQMVLLGRALAAQPQILILDEPESNLDFKNQLLILQTMSDLVSDGMSCIFNTHYPAHALQRANKALLLDGRGGYIFGDTDSVVTEQNIELSFGVKTVINEVEMPGNILRNVIPLKIADREADNKVMEYAGDNSGKRLAVIAIIIADEDMAVNINELLHEYSPYVIGRMGLPYRDRGVFIINITLEAPVNSIRALIFKLNNLPGVSVKATYEPEMLCNKDI
jgi:iron complex transport system ATP-binding protein